MSIPTNLEECYTELEKQLSQEDIEALRNEDDMIVYHFSLRLWIRNNWGLWKGSPLSKHLEDRGIWLPDEMSDFILRSFHDYLNNRNVQ